MEEEEGEEEDEGAMGVTRINSYLKLNMVHVASIPSLYSPLRSLPFPVSRVFTFF